MTITIKFFAGYRELAGVNQQTLEIGDAATVGDVIDQIEQQHPTFAGRLKKQTLAAINEIYVQRETPVHAQDTVAFFPPVSGG